MIKHSLSLILIVVFNTTCLSQAISTVSSQSVSIDLSIQWIPETIKFDGKKYENIPYLLITYRNNTVKNIYFFKVSNRKTDGLPPIYHERPLLTQIAEYENKNRNSNSQQKIKSDTSEKRYFVNIEFSPYCYNYWIIDTSDVINYNPINKINDEIFDIYSNLAKREKNDTAFNYENNYLLKSNLKIEEIVNSLDNKFIFFKAGASYTERFNLIVFKIVTGDFEFHIGNKYLSDFFYEEEGYWDESLKKNKFNKKYFPHNVKEYDLYSGPFLSNGVRIKF
jgi:hypothetical protein